MEQQAKKVVLMIESSSTWGRQLIKGVANYAHEHPHWHLQLNTLGFISGYHLPLMSNASGIIARVLTPGIAEDIYSTGEIGR